MKAGRDARGRFTAGNGYARKGGRARARKVDPERLSEIGRLGWAALVDRRFNGNTAAAREWWGRLGFHTYARHALEGTPNAHKLAQPNYAHPGTPEEFTAAYERRLAFTLDDVEALGY